ncbi:MAG TPA: SHOCT domain-containing protein [Jiangellaceae bacterium]|nr:SHOCT domain-containing protein [Jiangellaceae bacterium]
MDDYPLLDLFWTMLWFFLFIAWLFLLFTLFADIFRSRDMNGWAKALWVLFIIILPILGSLVYLIVRGRSMHERAAEDYQEREKAFRSYVQEAAGSAGGASVADELSKLSALRDSGALTAEEFEAQKAKLLS